MSVWADTAKAIRKDLKQAFPKEKFTVKSSYGTIYTAVHVYFDGTKFNRTQIRSVVDKYQRGSMGMFDNYEYTNHREDIPQVDFVLVQDLY